MVTNSVWVYTDEDGVPEVFRSLETFKQEYPEAKLLDVYPEARGMYFSVEMPDGVRNYIQQCGVI